MSDPTRHHSPHSVPTADPSPAHDTRSVGEPTHGLPGSSAGNGTPVAPPGYELLGEVGSGGMGIVFRARDLRLNRDVAVKVLQDKYAPSSLAARRFVDESQITGQLQHPGIPPVHEVGALPDGRPFLVMKLIKGRTLDEMLADGSANRGSLVGVFEQVCQAVAYAHNHGVIHRDLKPHNVMVGQFGEVQVMDWGLAKFRADARAETAEATTASTFHDPRVDSDDLRTRAGSFLGTPAFVSPEQAIGAVDQVDERSDVFGLGAVLCAILTGQPPFVGDTAESTRQMAAEKHLEPAFARLDACGDEPELVALCKRCLAGKRDDRPRNAGEVAAAVHAFRAEAEERAKQAELDRVRAEGERAKAEVEAREQKKRRRVQLALGAAVLGLWAAGGAFAWYLDRQASQRKAEALQRQVEDERIASEKREREGRNRDAFVASLERCEKALRDDDADTAAPALAEAQRRLSEGGTEEFAARVERCRMDLVMLKELDRIDDFRWTPVAGELPEGSKIAARCEQVFAGFGVVPGTTAPAEAARLVGDSLIRDRLLGASDLWLLTGGPPKLADILTMADPDAYRDAMRSAIRAGNAWLIQILAAHAAAIEQPARFAVALGYIADIPVERRRAVLRKAVAGQPGDLSILLALAHMTPISQAKSTAERVRWLQAAVAAHPRNVVARTNLACALYDTGEVDAAIREYRWAVNTDPKFAMIHYNLGTALHAKGQFEEAITEFQQAIALEPKDAQAHYNLGVALDDSGDLPGAIAAYREATRLDPKDSQAHSNLGRIYVQQKKYPEAIACARAAIAADPKYSKGHALLALALKRTGDIPGARAAMTEAIRLDPEQWGPLLPDLLPPLDVAPPPREAKPPGP
jgi:tetratricopeptide (TPR) repeat protein